MFCSNCGIEMSDGFSYCPQCGSAAGKASGFSPQPARPGRAFFRPRGDRKIAGVCAGIAQYLGVDVTLVRVLVVCLSIWPPAVGLIFYIVCWIVVPNEPLLLSSPENRTSTTASGATAS